MWFYNPKPTRQILQAHKQHSIQPNKVPPYLQHQLGPWNYRLLLVHDSTSNSRQRNDSKQGKHDESVWQQQSPVNLNATDLQYQGLPLELQAAVAVGAAVGLMALMHNPTAAPSIAGSAMTPKEGDCDEYNWRHPKLFQQRQALPNLQYQGRSLELLVHQIVQRTGRWQVEHGLRPENHQDTP